MVFDLGWAQNWAQLRASAKGKRLGRPGVAVDSARIGHLRAQGFGWKRIAADLGVGVGTVIRRGK